jgi:demethylmenaquinone methyltransferase/2-methoxy-6-polyprenyl-1,4-benzoquinol methylase
MGFLENKKRAKTFYKYFSIIYDKVNPLFWTPSMREKALDLFDIDSTFKVLDVGCGTGFGTEGLLTRTNNLFGIDQSIHQLNKARTKPLYSKVSLSLGDVEFLPFHDDTFDAVWSSGSIEYWPNPVQALSELRRIVKPGGKILIVGPKKPNWTILGKIAMSMMLFYTEKEADQLFSEAGFEKIQHIHLQAHFGSPPAIITLAHVPI